MSTQKFIVYIAEDEYERASLAELLAIKLDNLKPIEILSVPLVSDVNQILEMVNVHLMLIDIHSYGDETREYIDFEFINTSLYRDIPKIIIMVDKTEELHVWLNRNELVVDFSYRNDPKQLERLVDAIMKHL